MLATTEVVEMANRSNAPSSNLSAPQMIRNMRALCSQLNEAMRKATEEGYEVSLMNTPHLSSTDVRYPVVGVRVLLEVEPETSALSEDQ